MTLHFLLYVAVTLYAYEGEINKQRDDQYPDSVSPYNDKRQVKVEVDHTPFHTDHHHTKYTIHVYAIL